MGFKCIINTVPGEIITRYKSQRRKTLRRRTEARQGKAELSPRRGSWTSEAEAETKAKVGEGSNGCEGSKAHKERKRERRGWSGETQEG